MVTSDLKLVARSSVAAFWSKIYAVAFHYLIAEASGNYELAETLGRLHDRLLRFMVLCRVGETLEHRHSLVLEALRARDVAAARQAMLIEVNETHKTILERVIEEEGASWPVGNRTSE